MNKEAAPQTDVDNEFAEIVRREFNTDTSKALGGKAVGQTEPFGHQFMGDITESPSDPKATTPGGRTSTIDNGQASLDDTESNDVN